MAPTSHALFLVTDTDYMLLLNGIEHEVNRCRLHAVALPALSWQLLDVLRRVSDPEQRQYAAILLEKVEVLENSSSVAAPAM